MGTWLNSDGLYIKYGADESEVAKGGQYSTDGSLHEVEATLLWSDFASATAVLPINSSSYGIVIPKGARIEEVETVVETAFVNDGTVGTSTFVVGFNKADRTTALDVDGLLTSSATGTELGLATAGTKKTITVGSTGAGTLIGESLSENGVMVFANGGHASHPNTAGSINIRVRYRFV